MTIDQNIISILDDVGEAYKVILIDPDFADTAAFCEKYGYPIDNSGNTIICDSWFGKKVI